MKRPNILAGVPCFGGNLQHRCVSSLISVLRAWHFLYTRDVAFGLF